MIDIDDIWDDDEDMAMHGGTPVYVDPDSDTDPDWEAAKASFDCAVLALVKSAELLGAYMPSLATYLRLHADELADRFPDDDNQSV